MKENSGTIVKRTSESTGGDAAPWTGGPSSPPAPGKASAPSTEKARQHRRARPAARVLLVPALSVDLSTRMSRSIIIIEITEFLVHEIA